ncbi:MAG: DUF456 domain-containing protein [Flavobacteriaceae bacterium]
MDIILICLGFCLIIGGIIGSFLPVLPGPITSWFGLLLLYLCPSIPISYTILIISFIIAVGIFILDYFIPAMGAKKFGGSKYGIIGTTIGLILGLLFFPPFGIIIGPFVGALIGELVFGKQTNEAMKAAFGSLLGLLTSVFIKFFVALIYAGIFIWEFASHISNIF